VEKEALTVYERSGHDLCPKCRNDDIQSLGEVAGNATDGPTGRSPNEKPAGTGKVTFYAAVDRSYQLGDVGRFPKVNPLAQSYRLKALGNDMIGYACLCLKVRKDGAILARVRQVDSVSSHTGRGFGLGVYYSRSFIVRGIDADGLKDRSVWDPGDMEFKVVGTEKDKAGALLVFEPADPAKVKKPAARKEAKPGAGSKEDREAVAKQKLDFAESVMQKAHGTSGDAQARLEDLARSRLEEVVKNYPGTKAAKRAKELLDH
jgi:hypothetical protein